MGVDIGFMSLGPSFLDLSRDEHLVYIENYLANFYFFLKLDYKIHLHMAYCDIDGC